jgi:hypothetical protein
VLEAFAEVLSFGISIKTSRDAALLHAEHTGFVAAES